MVYGKNAKHLVQMSNIVNCKTQIHNNARFIYLTYKAHMFAIYIINNN